MKTITFQNIKLLNFCGISNAEYSLNRNIVNISGRNGIGKSTLANAIVYTLYGTDAKGNALNIKTYDKDHNIIPEIEHSAELTVSVDGESTTFKRTLLDSWKGKECKNNYKYFVNGEIYTASDYKKAVEAICPEITFRIASSPTFFAQLPWDKQRKFLEQLIPEIPIATITQGAAKYDFVVEALKKESIDLFLHHIKYKRTEIQKQLDNIPVRLRELNAVQTEAEDWDGLSTELKEKNSQADSISEQINAIQNGAVDQVRNDSLRKRIEFQHKRIDEMEKGARNISVDERTKHDSDLINARKEKSQAQSVVDELKAKMQGFTESEIQLNAQLQQQKEDIKEAGAQYQEINSESWSWKAKDGICRYCGQALPFAEINRLKAESEQRFNLDKAERLKALLARADEIKAEHKECKDLLDNLNEERSSTTKQLTKAHKALNDAEARLKEVEKEKPRSYEEILQTNENYSQAATELKRLEDELSKPSELSAEQQNMLNELLAKKSSLTAEINTLSSRLAKKESFDRINDKIEEVENDKKTYQKQLDELDTQLDITSEYNQRSCSIIEESVNGFFSFVQWSLFKSNLDGEKKPFCECYHQGVPYSQLNTAARINAGIDIAHTFAKYYDLSVPMILDECESNLSPLSFGSQQIRLYVSNDNELTFSYGD